MADHDDKGPWPLWPGAQRGGDPASADPEALEVRLREAERRAAEAEKRAAAAESDARAIEAEARASEARAAAEAGRQRRPGVLSRRASPSWTPQVAPARSSCLGKATHWAVGSAFALVILVVLVVAIFNPSGKTGKEPYARFESAAAFAPRSPELAPRAGAPLVLVTGGSRSEITSLGGGRLLIGPGTRSGTWQVGVADLTQGRIAWSRSMASSGIGAAEASNDERSVLEPGRAADQPQDQGWTLLDASTGETRQAGERDPRGGAVLVKGTLLQTRSTFGGECRMLELNAMTEPSGNDVRWTSRLVQGTEYRTRATFRDGLIWLGESRASSYREVLPELYSGAVDPATGGTPGWYTAPDCATTTTGYLPVKADRVLKVTQPKKVSRDGEWKERRATMLDAEGRELWTSSDPVMVHDGRVYTVTQPSSVGDEVAGSAQLLDTDTGKPVWQRAVPGMPIATVGDRVILHGYPGLTVARLSDGAVRTTHPTGRSGSVVVREQDYLVAVKQDGNKTAVAAYTIADDRPLWSQLYPIADAVLVSSGDRIALHDRRGIILPLVS